MSDKTTAERRRLPPQVRVQQILDAAFHVFAEKGFVATRIDDIAAAAGLSKGGVYNHFSSKEEIFSSMVRYRVEQRPPIEMPDEATPVTVDLICETFVAPVYAVFADDDEIRLLRIIMVEAARSTEHPADRLGAYSQPFVEKLQQVVDRGIEQGNLKASAFSRSVGLIVTPALGYMFNRLVGGETSAAAVAAYRAEHIALLREVLTADKE